MHLKAIAALPYYAVIALFECAEGLNFVVLLYDGLTERNYRWSRYVVVDSTPLAINYFYVSETWNCTYYAYKWKKGGCKDHNGVSQIQFRVTKYGF